MRCAVANCKSHNNNKKSYKKFFSFPTDKHLRKLWIRFCRGSQFSINTARVCMEHFTAEDFANKMQYEMGLSRKLILKPGVVPTIRNAEKASSPDTEERCSRMEARNRKKIVEELLKDASRPSSGTTSPGFVVKSDDEDDPKEEVWQSWCRLCGKIDPDTNIAIFANDKISGAGGAVKSVTTTTLAASIAKFFWVQISPEEDLPKMMCCDCYNLVSSLVVFSERVSKVQQMFWTILRSRDSEHLDLDAIRTKYGIRDDERELIIFTKPLIVEDFDKTDDKDNELEYVSEIECLDPLKSNPEPTVNEFVIQEDVEQDYVEDEMDLVMDKEEEEMPQSDEDSQTERNFDFLDFGEVPEYWEVYPCSICQREFKHAEAYKRHMRIDHPGFALKLECPQCNAEVRGPYSLKRHLRLHLPLEMRKSYPCTICDQKFTTENNARLHIESVHSGKKPFKCMNCPYAGRTYNALKEHMAIHLNIAPHECDQCHKKFKRRTALTNHMLTHDGDKFICDECGARLSSKPSLNQHKLTHSERSNRLCRHCGRSFQRSESLKRHINFHTCNTCGQSFKCQTQYNIHKQKVHPSDLTEDDAAEKKDTIQLEIPETVGEEVVIAGVDMLSYVEDEESIAQTFSIICNE